MDPISKFLLESSFGSEFRTPSQLLDWMSDVRYGWCDKTGKKYTGKDSYGNIFWEKYSMLLPEEVYKKKIGVCWDQSIFEKWIFDNVLNVESKLVWIQQHKVSTHTFLVYKENGKWMYFENAAAKYRGIHGPYNTIEPIVKQVYKQMQDIENGKDGYTWSYMDPKKFRKKLTCKQFLNACGYDYTKAGRPEEKVLYHGSPVQNLKSIDPRDKTKHDGKNLKRIYATDEKQYAAAFTFPSTSDFCEIYQIKGKPWIVKLSEKYKPLLMKPCSIYTISAEGFTKVKYAEYTKDSSTKVLKEEQFKTALECMEKLGVTVKFT